MLRARRGHSGLKQPPKPKRRIRKLRLFSFVGVLSVLTFVSFCFGFIEAIGASLSQLRPEYQQNVEVDGRILARDGHTVLAVLRGSEARTLDRPDQINWTMKHAIVDIEDRRFFQHGGIDVRGMLRAAWTDIMQGKVVEGGSTITQQYVKNTYRQNQRTIGRKLREAALAWDMERRWSKDQILTDYLNTIYFGNGAYGVERAARTYFGHGANKLTLPEAALLAGIPRDPGLYDPIRNPKEARARRALVLQKMVEQGDITAADARRANRAPLPRVNHGQRITSWERVPFFTDYVKDMLVRHLGAGTVYGGGLEVTTSIDLGLQKLAEKAVEQWLPDPLGPAAALVAIDPRSGEILAMVGGRNYKHSQFNLATQSQRQAGSAFKPFVLTAALEEGLSPSSTLVSRPLYLSLGDRFWSVSNSEDSYLGRIDLRTATTYSDNTVFAQLTQIVQPRAVAAAAKALGIQSQLAPYLSIGLGTDLVNPLEMARAFGTLANGGVRIDGSGKLANEPRAVLGYLQLGNTRLCKKKRLCLNDEVPTPETTPNDAAVVTSLLENVISYGTGRRAALPDRVAAGKTGTTENYGDAWFVGYTPQLVVAVWVGYPNKLVPMDHLYHGQPVAGGTYPALIWKSFMESAFPYLARTDPSGSWEPEYFPNPSYPYSVAKQVVWRNSQLMLDNGNCHNSFPLVYFDGFGPTNVARCKPNEVEVPNVVGMKLDKAEQRLALQPLNAEVLYKRAKALQRPNVVIDQDPRKGTLSSYDSVIVVLAKPVNGLVPNVVGLTLLQARAKLKSLGLRLGAGGFTQGSPGLVVAQRPRAGGAVKPGMTVALVVGRG
ncbi:MAG: PBP1A family penicillin-binding protein [Gaiellaceae bacterium]